MINPTTVSVNYKFLTQTMAKTSRYLTPTSAKTNIPVIIKIVVKFALPTWNLHQTNDGLEVT